jgi:alkaline phosphatase D
MVRAQIGDECYTLDEYRQRYAQYKSDPDLKAAHAAAPWFMTFDDHEVSNNWAGAIDRFDSPPEAFALRRAMAWQAWAEHMPIRRPQEAALTGVRVYRRAAYGDLLQAHFLDTRQFRSDQPCGDGFQKTCDDINKPDARMMSAEEESWLYKGLAAKNTSWNLIGQQTMVLNLDRRGASGGDTPILNMDSWAGYQTPRVRFLKKLEAMKLQNVVVLTGDEHQHYVNELRPRTGDSKSPIVAHEFVATSISSGGDGPGERPDTATILSHNPDCKLINDKRGYALCEVTPESWQTSLKTVDKVSVEGGKLSTLATFVVERGAAGVKPG